MRDKFYDPKLKGLNWQAMGDKHRDAYAEARSDAQRSAAINALLGELRASHTHHYTKDETAYYELVDIFAYPLRREIPKHFAGGNVRYAGVGMFTRDIGGKTFVTATFPDQPAARAGLLAGDEIVSAAGAPFQQIASFRGKIGEKVTLKVRRKAGGEVQDIVVEPQWIEPGETFEAALRDSARIIEANGKRIGYVRVWSYAGNEYQNQLEAVLSEGKLKDADAVIWDLRDGWGGAHPRYLSVFNTYARRWLSPAAMRNASCRLSLGQARRHAYQRRHALGQGSARLWLQEERLRQVVGERTAGALLAGTAFLLSDGSLLILAVEDAAVDGERIEGIGVAPTIGCRSTFAMPPARIPNSTAPSPCWRTAPDPYGITSASISAAARRR